MCIVEDIAQRELIKHVKRLYYKLRPIYQQNNIIYAPAESDKVLIRPVISKDEADALIKKMPEIYGDASQAAEDGEFGFANCEELAATAVRIHRKKRAAKSARQKARIKGLALQTKKTLSTRSACFSASWQRRLK